MISRPLPSTPGRNPFPTPGLSPSPKGKAAAKLRQHIKPNPQQVSPKHESQVGDVAQGRIISNSYPLRDFKKNLERGDVVSKALTDMALVIPEIVEASFSSQRYSEAIDCMVAMRKTALEVNYLPLIL